MKKIIFPLFLIIAATANVKPKQNPIMVEAAPLPTTIITSNLVDADVNDYYAGINGLKGSELLAGLNNIIKDHVEFSYNDSNIFKIIDRDWELDALDTESKADTTNFKYSTDDGFLHKLYADYNGNINTAHRVKNPATGIASFDKEHIWAQSLGQFGRSNGAGSDLHALWAADTAINRHAHSNYNYAVPEVDIVDRLNDNNTYGGRNGYLLSGGDKVFEPLDKYKGDIARAMFYMPARYFEYEDETHPKLELVFGNPESVYADQNTSGKAGDLATLLEWHEEDPVDAFEIKRNNLIYNNFQKNRNPFIDYPNLARLAYDPDYKDQSVNLTLGSSSVGDGYDPFGGLELTDISLDTGRLKTTYLLGEKFAASELIVNAHFTKDGEPLSKRITNYTLSIASGTTLETSGELDIIVTFVHNSITKTATFTITVSEQGLSDFLYISEVYGGGGNSGATHTHDFVELYNYADFSISLNGLSVQYSTASPANENPNWKVMPLSGVIPAKSYYLIQAEGSLTNGITLPLANTYSTTGIGATGFMVALINGTVKLDVLQSSTDARTIDMVGTGSNVVDKYVAAAPPPNATKSIQRSFILNNVAPPATPDNSKDYISATPTPLNSALGIAQEIMRENTINQCITLYPIMKTRVLDLSTNIYDEDEESVLIEGQLSYFQNANGGIMEQGRTRYLAWAAYHHDETPYEYISLNSADQNTDIRHETISLAVILISVFFVFGLYFLIKYKNDQINS